MILVTVVSPNPALRVGLRKMLSDAAGISVVGEAADLDELDALNQETDVLVVASVSVLSGFREDDPAVLLLTDDPQEVGTLISSRLPAWGVLAPGASEDEIVASVRALGEGLWVGNQALLRDFIRQPKGVTLSGREELAEPLTARETEVLNMVAQGLANKQIALALEISEHTVKFHISSLYTKLNASSRTEAVRIGLKLGLIAL